MADVHEAKGSCLCSQVKITVKTMSSDVGACHCSMCRNWLGGPFMGVDCGTEVQFEGEDSIAIFNSSQWAERGFCSQCGSHLFYRLKDNQQYIMPVGLFKEVEDFNFDHQIFIEEKPAYYNFANNTKNMTGEEIFAQFAPEAH